MSNEKKPIDGSPTVGDDEALSGYLLDDLDPGDRDRVERRLAQDSALREREQRLAPLVRQLEHLSSDAWAFIAAHHAGEAAAAMEALAPSASVREEGLVPSASIRRPRWWQTRLSVRPALAALSAAALLAVGGGLVRSFRGRQVRAARPWCCVHCLESLRARSPAGGSLLTATSC
jgi:anti-sigma factor RsiW